MYGPACVTKLSAQALALLVIPGVGWEAAGALLTGCPAGWLHVEAGFGCLQHGCMKHLCGRLQGRGWCGCNCKLKLNVLALEAMLVGFIPCGMNLKAWRLLGR